MRLLGKEVTEALNLRLTERVHALKARGIRPTLALIRIGEEPSDLAYERGAKKRAELIGIDVRQFLLPYDVPQEEVLSLIDEVNADKTIHGVLLFRPFPNHLNAEMICNRLEPKKDVDCMTTLSSAGVFLGRRDLGFAPCTPEACMEILAHYNIDLRGKNAVVIGRSMVVGKPLAMLLLQKDATVTICHTKTVGLAEICKKADILITAAGCAGSVTKEFVRGGQIVLDVSVNSVGGEICGDAVLSEVEPIVAAITPVPGGVGSVTTSILMKHVIEAADTTSC